MATKEDEVEFHCLEEEKTSQINMCSGSDWDDSVLIHAYDKAMNKVKAEVARKNNIALNGPMNEHKGKARVQKSKKKAKNVEEWKVGEYCQAQYSGDGVIYEAVIIDINESDAVCLIRYIGYENEEEIAIDLLLPSEGRFARMAQEKMARSEMQSTEHDDESVSYSEEGSERSRCDRRSDRSYQYILNRDKASESLPRYSCCSPSHAPPPSAVPPPFLFDREGNEDDKLYSMLLSWYMSGYHTGFYLGSRQANRRQSSRDCNYQCH